jgi:hypothetical protein
MISSDIRHTTRRKNSAMDADDSLSAPFGRFPDRLLPAQRRPMVFLRQMKLVLPKILPDQL